MLMRSYRGPIHMMEVPVQLPFGVRLPLELCKDVLPYPGLYPAVEAGGDALPGAKLLREVAPGCSSAIYPQDGLHDGAVISGGSASFRFLGRQKWSYPLPLLVGQCLSCHAPSLTPLKTDPRLRLVVRRCVNPACEFYQCSLRPEEEGAFALPQGEFGLDVIALVGALRYARHRSVPEIHEELLGRGVLISERSVTNLLEAWPKSFREYAA